MHQTVVGIQVCRHFSPKHYCRPGGSWARIGNADINGFVATLMVLHFKSQNYEHKIISGLIHRHDAGQSCHAGLVRESQSRGVIREGTRQGAVAHIQRAAGYKGAHTTEKLSE